MSESGVYRSEHSTYSIEVPTAFAYGRASACFRARDAANNLVCLKVFTQLPVSDGVRDGTVEFLAEIAARVRVTHPNILPILDHGRYGAASEKVPFIVMPMCERDLRALMRRHAFLPMPTAMGILRQVAAAIDHAHSMGLIHGDVKPANVLFRHEQAQVFLSDFGTSRFFTYNEAMMTIPPGASAGGTTAYLSPEQIEHNHQSSRSDIYSFAAMAFEMLCGGLPIDPGLPPFKQMQAKVAGMHRQALELNPGLSESVAAWLDAGLARDPKDRPASAMALCAGFESGVAPGAARQASVQPVKEPPPDAASTREAPQPVGRTVPDLLAMLISAKGAVAAVAAAVLLVALVAFVHWQAAPGAGVELFGQKLWNKAGAAPPSCLALKHLRELDFGSGNKSRFCAGTFHDDKNKFDGVLNLPGTDYQDAWCYRGDLEMCRAEAVKREAQGRGGN